MTMFPCKLFSTSYSGSVPGMVLLPSSSILPHTLVDVGWIPATLFIVVQQELQQECGVQ